MKALHLVTCLLLLVMTTTAQAESQRHALALGAEPKYPADFTHFDYTNPDAPRGGTRRQATLGGFDSFNPFLATGLPERNIGLIYDTLTIASLDEPFTKYGLLAETMELAEDNTWIIFRLRKEATFHDGVPVTAHDIVFSFNIIMEKGSPIYKQYYGDVASCEALDDHTVKFTFKTDTNRELPLIIGAIPALPKHFWETRDFGKANLEIPLGSGPYKLESFDEGRSSTYVLNTDYWAMDLPVARGTLNVDKLQFEYYRDAGIALEAFKAGEYDIRDENVAKQWATGYTGPAFDEGLIKKEEIKDQTTYGLQAFVFNTRRDVFKDPVVRQAMAYAFDFEWANANLFHDQYTRSASYFSNGELESSGLPSPAELELLEPLRGQIPDEVFTQTYTPPSTAAPSSLRGNLKQGLQLLLDAGWTLEDGIMTKDGVRLEFEYLLRDPNFERIVLPFFKNLERMGIKANPRMVDLTNWLERVRSFDFDMTTVGMAQSESPGNEMRFYFHSQAAEMNDSHNFMGIKNPAVDTLVEAVVNAKDREALVTAVKALDRVLLWNHYVIPGWHNSVWRVAYWDKFDRPAIQPKYAVGIGNWWIDLAKRAKVMEKRPGLEAMGF